MPAMDHDRIAHLYDAYVRWDLTVPFFLKEAQKTHGPILELTAGTGRVSLPLLRAGVDLTCVDSSPAMLEILREKLRAEDLSAEAAGFVPVHLYGDYSYGPFDPETSPVMIWVLRDARAETT